MSTQTIDDVTLLHYVWKNPTMELCAGKIIGAAFKCGDVFWPDEIDFGTVPESSKNCIGTAFRTLSNLGIIKRTNSFRRSKSKATHGRTVFAYTLASQSLAETLASRINPNIRPNGYLPL